MNDIDSFVFDGTPVDEGMARKLPGGDFVEVQRNATLVGGVGTGETHLGIAIAAAMIPSRPRPLLQPGRSGQPARTGKRGR